MDEVVVSTMGDMAAVSPMGDRVAVPPMGIKVAVRPMGDRVALSPNLVVNEILRPGHESILVSGDKNEDRRHVQQTPGDLPAMLNIG